MNNLLNLSKIKNVSKFTKEFQTAGKYSLIRVFTSSFFVKMKSRSINDLRIGELDFRL